MKIAIGEYAQYEYLVERAKQQDNRPLHLYMNIVPVNFSTKNRSMLGNVRKWIDKGHVAIDPDLFPELLTADEEMSLHKTEYSMDLLDSLRLSPLVRNSVRTSLSKYETPKWVKNRNRNGGHLCWSCYTIIRNTGKVFSQERKANIKAGIRRAVENGVVFGRKVYTINEAAFDVITEESAYWIGFLIADGNVYTGKTGNPRIALTLKKKDYNHLVKFRKFMGSTYNILTKKVKLNDKTIIQYTLRFSSKIVARVLATYGIVPKKSLIAKVIGLENNRDFWRGVLDGDGHFCVRNGHEADKIILVGSHDLLHQFKDFVQRNIPESITKKSITIKQEGSYYRLFIYSKTARLLAKLLYDDCTIALDRKLPKALKMIYS